MQSNIECIMDDLNEFPDSWVELYNSGSVAVDLSAYKIGLKSEKNAYRLPEMKVGPGEKVLVYCDKSATGLHTDFRLESGSGGALYLYRDGMEVDALVKIPKMPSPDISYGRSSDGGDVCGFLPYATPGKPNPGVIAKGVLGSPVFSHPGRVAATTLTLHLSVPEGEPQGTVIRFTTDGSEPTSSSRLYAGLINIASSTVVRARLFNDGYASSYAVTHSYIFHPRAMSLPIISIVSDPRYFDDPEIGIHCIGKDPQHPNYENNWRRPVNIEMFMDENSDPIVNQLIETRLKGHWSRRYGLKSHVIYANKRFGTKCFGHEFFPDDYSGVDEWKSLELRNAGNDFTGLYLRDAMMQRVFGRNVDVDWQPYQPCVLTINGEYRGMLNLRTRSNEDYVEAVYGGLEDIDMVENWRELKAGSIDSYNDFRSFYSVAGHTLEEYEELMDVDEFMHVFMASIFFDNKDFPANNIVMWRPTESGGRWRWIMKDLDNGLGIRPLEPTYNTLKWILDEKYDAEITGGNNAESTLLFRRLEALQGFRERMIDRFAVYMGDFLRADNLKAVVHEMSQAIEGELPYHFAAHDIGGGWHTYDEWREMNLGIADRWIEGRIPFVYDMLAEHYGLGHPVDVTVAGNVSGGDGSRLRINGIGLSGSEFDGKWFVGRRLTLDDVASGSDADSDKGWEVVAVRDGAKDIKRYSGSVLDIVVPECDRLEIRRLSDLSGLNTSVEESIESLKAPLTLYDLAGRKVGTVSVLSEAKRYNGVCIIVDAEGKTVKLKL
ncbi:MAG: CotH kinase family protein [Paramuribaculum sp.]|nr:CotH kinase family protein [Paramuribaculum sp.]